MIKDKILAAKIAINDVLNSNVPKHEVYEALEELEAEIQSCLESLEDDTNDDKEDGEDDGNVKFEDLFEREP